MKRSDKIWGGLVAGGLLAGMAAACSDFEDINKSPSSAGVEVMAPDYLLNKSLYEAQQDPAIAERLFIYNWADAARFVNWGFITFSNYSDDFNNQAFDYMAEWIRYASEAVKLSETVENVRLKDYYANIGQIARIWRAMLIADFTDSFGPYPLDGFQGKNPTFNSVEEVYDFLLAELKDAASRIKEEVAVSEEQAKGDDAFGYNGEKWVRLANSLRLRYAVRLSEVAPAKAQAEFEEAVQGKLLTDGVMSFREAGGWSCWEGVYTREWNDCVLSAALCNLYAGLGDVKVGTDYRADLAEYVKPMTYLGLRFDRHYPTDYSNNPTVAYWMDGIPEHLDPRALKIWFLQNDKKAENYHERLGEDYEKYVSKFFMRDPDDPEKDEKAIHVDAQFCWNGVTAGTDASLCPKTYKFNDVEGYAQASIPMLGKQFRDNSNRRIWFANWETYFLLAEGAVRGWAAPVTAKEAYEQGVRASFDYLELKNAEKYLASESYNRVGTSVNFDHTVEPVDFEADYVDGYTKQSGKTVYKYPDASKILYKGHKLNDQLTKIITQKYLANVPYGALEAWNDHRRLGLPFFESPANELPVTGNDMEGHVVPELNPTQKWDHFPQRMRYPSNLDNADREQFKYALQLLGSDKNDIMAPLWWAMH